MKFVYPWMLVLVALVPVTGALWVFLRTRAEKRLAAFVAPSLQSRLLPRNPRLFSLQAFLLLTGLGLVLFAASRPQWGQSAQKMQIRSRNVVVAVDVSRSMLATDVRPNRLERAKADIADLIDSLENDRCALVAFRRTGELLCPLTSDHAFLRSALENTTIDSAPRGETDLGSAIRTSLNALDAAKDEHNAIILISDGGDLRGGAIDAARDAKKRTVPVFTVGIGNDKLDSTVPDASGKGSQTYKGQTVKTRLENKTLEQIAKESGGRYVPLATAGTAETTLSAIYRHFLRQVAEEDIAEEEELRATERFGWFLVPGIFLVLLAALFSRGRFAGRRTRSAAAAAILAMCFAVRAEESTTTNTVPESVLPETETPIKSETQQLTDGEVWNNGVDYYRAGDMTNALATLRPLMLSRTHGARAAEVVGAIRHADMDSELAKAKEAQGVQAEDAALAPMKRALEAGEESAWAMQRALRAAPEDKRANNNFTLSLDGLEKLREDIHVAEVLAAAKNKDPRAQMEEASREALALLHEQSGVLTNEAGVAIARSEALAKRAEVLADALIPLKQQVFKTVTNEQQAAQIIGDVEATRDTAKLAADQLADLSIDAAESLSKTETAFHRYWKGMIDAPTALNEGLLSQSNAVTRAERVNGRDWQQEALEFSAIFGTRFPEWVQQLCAQDVSASTNEPPYTARVAQEIGGAMQEIAKKQESLTKEVKAEDQTLVLAGLNRVRDRCGLLAGDPRQLAAADLLMQTNAYTDVKRTDGFDWQKDALDHTRVFRARFPSWAQQYEQQAQSNTNMPPFTKEQQAEVATLAAAVEKIQADCVKEPVPPDQLDAIRKIERIRELLPPDQKQQNQQQNQQQQQQQQNQNQQQQQQQQDQQQDQNKDQNKDQDQNQDQQQEEQKEEKKEQPAKQEENPDQKEAEELIRKAFERSDEHEAEKKARLRKVPLSPNERDW